MRVPSVCTPVLLDLFVCRVREGVNLDTQKKVAIKILDKEKVMTQDLGESIKKEISFETLSLNSA